MATYTEKFKSLAAAYRGASIEFPRLKPVTIAQWMYESAGAAASWRQITTTLLGSNGETRWTVLPRR